MVSRCEMRFIKAFELRTSSHSREIERFRIVLSWHDPARWGADVRLEILMPKGDEWWWEEIFDVTKDKVLGLLSSIAVTGELPVGFSWIEDVWS